MLLVCHSQHFPGIYLNASQVCTERRCTKKKRMTTKHYSLVIGSQNV